MSDAQSGIIETRIPGRHRRRVRGHQLGQGRADPGPAPGSGPPWPCCCSQGPVPVDLGWRLAFGLGAVLGLGILLVRRNVPESPRWLFIHGHNDQAEELVDGIERRVEEETGRQLEEVTGSIKIRQRHSIGFGAIAHTAFKRYPTGPSSGWRCSSARRSSTTPCSSPRRWC